MSAAGPDTRRLRQDLEAEGRARIDAIRRAAADRVEALRARHAAELERRRAEALRGPERELREALARDLATARVEGEGAVLRARQALLDRVFDRARARLAAALETPAARRRLVARAHEALRFVPPGPAVIACSPGVDEVLGRELGDVRDDVTLERRADLPPGFRVEAAGGALVVDATLEQLLEAGRPSSSIEVLRALEERVGTDGEGPDDARRAAP